MSTKCPQDEALGSYLEHRLSAEQTSTIEAHLADCDTCLDRLIMVKGLIHKENSEPDPAPEWLTDNTLRMIRKAESQTGSSWIERAKNSLRNFYGQVSDRLNLTSRSEDQCCQLHQMQPVRGGTGGILANNIILLSDIHNQTEIEIEIEKISTNLACIRIFPQIHTGNCKLLRVTLRSGNREMASKPMDGGYTLFDDVPFGKYCLDFIKDGQCENTYSFEITEPSSETIHGTESP